MGTQSKSIGVHTSRALALDCIAKMQTYQMRDIALRNTVLKQIWRSQKCCTYTFEFSASRGTPMEVHVIWTQVGDVWESEIVIQHALL